MVTQTHNKTMLVSTPFGRYSKIFIADMQILGSAFCFGIGFLGQRAVMVHGLGPMTCNAFRFGLSTILLVACLPMIPIDEPELESEDEDYDGESGHPLMNHGQNDGHINGSPRSKSGNEIENSPGSGGLKTASRDVGESSNSSNGSSSSSSSSSNNKRPNSSGSKSSSNTNASMSSSSSQSQSQSQQQSAFGGSSNANATAIGGAAKKASVLLKLLGPVGVTKMRNIKRTVWFWGVLLGLINFCGSGFQQWGISLTSASKCAFIAGFDLFLTPVFSLFVPTFKHNAKPTRSTWLAVGIAIWGLFLLSGATYDDLELGMGETLTVISTVFWTLHITYTDMATTYVDSISMMCIQLGVVTLLSCFAALTLEPQQWLWDHIWVFFPWLIFLAVSEGLGFTLMAVGQNYSPPTHAAIILSLEGVFASVASYMFLDETLTTRELSGCFLMLMAALVAKVGCSCIDSHHSFIDMHSLSHDHHDHVGDGSNNSKSHNSSNPHEMSHGHGQDSGLMGSTGNELGNSGNNTNKKLNNSLMTSAIAELTGEKLKI